MFITLLTDFGTSDAYVAAMKGVILSRDERIRIVDITHEVPPQDTATAGYLLSSVYRDFPPGTVHTVVVDPGVGSDRRPIACSAGGHYLVGPDNGVLDWVLARHEDVEVRAVENEDLFRKPVSRTFHGRDIFAPTAAALATGVPLADLGRTVNDRVRAPGIAPELLPDCRIRGSILHVDRFGNGITSFRERDLPGGPEAYRYRVGPHEVDTVQPYFAAGTAAEPFVYWGSAGYLEIALNGASAAEALGFRRGVEVVAAQR